MIRIHILSCWSYLFFHTWYFWYRTSSYAATYQMLSQSKRALHCELCRYCRTVATIKFLCWDTLLSNDIFLKFCNLEQVQGNQIIFFSRIFLLLLPFGYMMNFRPVVMVYCLSAPWLQQIAHPVGQSCDLQLYMYHIILPVPRYYCSKWLAQLW